MTTNSTDTTANLTIGGIWAYESAITAAGSSTTAQLTYKPAGGDCSAVVDVDGLPLHRCPAAVDRPADHHVGATPSPIFPFTMESEPPAAPGTPTVTALDSGLNVSWPPSTTRSSYVIHVQNAEGMEQGQSPITITGGGTSAQVFGLTDNVQYNVFVEARTTRVPIPPAPRT